MPALRPLMPAKAGIHRVLRGKDTGISSHAVLVRIEDPEGFQEV